MSRIIHRANTSNTSENPVVLIIVWTLEVLFVYPLFFGGCWLVFIRIWLYFYDIQIISFNQNKGIYMYILS